MANGPVKEYLGETPKKLMWPKAKIVLVKDQNISEKLQKELMWPKAGIETSSDTNVKNSSCS